MPRTGHAGALWRGAWLSGHILMHGLPPMRMLFNPAHEELSPHSSAGHGWPLGSGFNGARASRVRACRTPPMHPIAPRSVSEQRLTALRSWE
jgi:hypothetical protein